MFTMDMCSNYSVIITWQSNPPISQFNSPCNYKSHKCLVNICIYSRKKLLGKTPEMAVGLDIHVS